MGDFLLQVFLLFQGNSVMTDENEITFNERRMVQRHFILTNLSISIVIYCHFLKSQ